MDQIAHQNELAQKLNVLKTETTVQKLLEEERQGKHEFTDIVNAKLKKKV